MSCVVVLRNCGRLRNRSRLFTLLGANPADINLLGLLNNDNKFDIGISLNNFYGNDIETNPYLAKGLITKYTDVDGLINNPEFADRDLFISINVCSLNSKYSELKEIIVKLNQSGLNIIAIALQEI